MELDKLKRLVSKNVIDFSELLLLNYHKLDLDETDVVMLIKLHHMINNNVSFIGPKQLSKQLSISTPTTAKRLNNLIDKEFIRLELVIGENGKEKEKYNLDKVMEKILAADQEKERKQKKQSIEAELVELFETEFKKQLSVLDIQIITKWLNEDKYTVDEIREALFKSVKARKLTIKYVDAILLNTEKEAPKTYKKTNLMRDLHKLWEK